MDTYKKYDELQENVWTNECEELLAEWSEKASCYRWLHGRCEKKYQRSYYSFSIPVIILSTLTGAANVGMDSFVAEENKSIASAIVGGVNILAGIVSTLQNFLKVAELMEAHRIAGVSWGKLQRNISIELALDPSRRVLQSDFLKLSRAEYDRLIEAGPIIDDSIIAQFNKKFKNYGVSVPSICNGLDKCNIYKIDKTIKTQPEIFEEGIEDIIHEQEKNMKSKNPKEIIEIEINKTTESRPDTEEEPKLLPDSTVETKLTETKLTETELLRTSLDDEDINLLKESLDKETQVDGELEKEDETKNDEIKEDEIKEDDEVSEDNTLESEFIKGISDN